MTAFIPSRHTTVAHSLHGLEHSNLVWRVSLLYEGRITTKVHCRRQRAVTLSGKRFNAAISAWHETTLGCLPPARCEICEASSEDSHCCKNSCLESGSSQRAQCTPRGNEAPTWHLLTSSLLARSDRPIPMALPELHLIQHRICPGSVWHALSVELSRRTFCMDLVHAKRALFNLEHLLRLRCRGLCLITLSALKGARCNRLLSADSMLLCKWIHW